MATALALAACGDDETEVQIELSPPLQPEVGVELGVPLHAYAGGQAVEWSWRSLTNPGLLTRARRPTLTAYTGGNAVWRWTPIGEDRGDQEIEFTARAGVGSKAAVLRFTIDEGGTAPVFREPIGEGTTLDLRAGPCAKVRITVESSVSSEVELGVAEPPENLDLLQTGPLAGELSFCPSAAQILDETVYPLTLTARAAPHLVSRVYVIVLRRAT